MRKRAMEFFDRQWSSYRAIVEHDLMEHQAVADATATALEHWLAARAADAPAPTLLDLGCGDLALLAPLLRRLPLGSYTGLDLAPVVLPLARQALGPVPYSSQWVEGDLLGWAEGRLEIDAASRPDILHSAFAIHHLPDEAKARFLEEARRRLAPGGLLLWADVFREPGEARESYLKRYSGRMRGWQVLTPEQRERAIDHVHQCDLPAERGRIEAVAAAAGWHWRWAWQGSHRAEALAVLTPA